MKRYVIILALILPVSLLAQERRIVVRNFDVNLLDPRATTDPVYDNKGQATALIEISLATTDSLLIEGNQVKCEQGLGKWLVYMPEGSQWIEFSVNGCEKCHFEFPAEKPLLPGLAYSLDLVIKVLNPMRTLVMPTFSYNQSQYSYGIMLAFCRRNGGFIHAKTDFNFGLNPIWDCSSDGIRGDVKGWFTDKSQKSRYSITVGYMRQVVAPLYLFIGGGYGSRILAWEMYRSEGSYEYARVDQYSFTGYEIEMGAILRLGAFAISAGVQTNQFKYFEANAGIGVMF